MALAVYIGMIVHSHRKIEKTGHLDFFKIVSILINRFKKCRCQNLENYSCPPNGEIEGKKLFLKKIDILQKKAKVFLKNADK